MPKTNGDLFSTSFTCILSQFCAHCQSDFMPNPTDRFPTQKNISTRGTFFMKNILCHIAFIGTILFSAHDAAHAAGTCGTTGYPCQTQSYTIDGTLYCRSATNQTCTTGAGGTASATGYVFHTTCENGKGTGGSAICRLPSSSLCASGYVFDDTYVCVKAECGPGYTGTATGANNAGCTACTGKPNNATYTTNNSCAWKCNDLYYRNATRTSCIQCPQSSEGGIYVNSYLNATCPGITSDTAATSITDCYIPSGTYYDSTGTFAIATGNKCSYTN